MLDSNPNSVRPSDTKRHKKKKRSQAGTIEGAEEEEDKRPRREIEGIEEEEEEHIKAKIIKRGTNVALPSEANMRST